MIKKAAFDITNQHTPELDAERIIERLDTLIALMSKGKRAKAIRVAQLPLPRRRSRGQVSRATYQAARQLAPGQELAVTEEARNLGLSAKALNRRLHALNFFEKKNGRPSDYEAIAHGRGIFIRRPY